MTPTDSLDDFPTEPGSSTGKVGEAPSEPDDPLPEPPPGHPAFADDAANDRFEPKGTLAQTIPNDFEAEGAVLGSILLDPAAFDVVAPFLHAGHFYANRHIRIYQAAQEVRAQGKPVDNVTVGTRLREMGRIAEVGGMPYLTLLLQAAPNPRHVRAYAEIVYDKARRRTAVLTGQRLVAKGYAGSEPVDAIITEASRNLDSIPMLHVKQSIRLGQILDKTIDRIAARMAGDEAPIPLPWASLNPHFGGGLWGGVHMLNAGTGAGKTQFATQIAIHAAKGQVPVLSYALEMGDFDIAVRSLGDESRVPWSKAWKGQLSYEQFQKLKAARENLYALPIHPEFAPPHGLGASEVRDRLERFRREYPDTSKPALVIFDFLQLVGDDEDRPRELRERIGRMAYVLKDCSKRLNLAVLCISSVARDRYRIMSDLRKEASLEWDEDPDGCPINRRVLDPDAIVGLGKESGDIEFSADSVSALGKVPQTWDQGGYDAVFVTAKGRADGATWSPLHFSGTSYTECTDRGGRLVEAWTNASEKQAQRIEANRERAQKTIFDDATLLKTYLADHPGAHVGECKALYNNNYHRWQKVREELDAIIVERSVKADGTRRVGLFLRTPEEPATGIDPDQ